MLNFLTNSKEYEIQANGQLSSILSQFDSDYVMHVIEATLEDQFLYFDILEKPNAVKAFEQQFYMCFGNQISLLRSILFLLMILL